MELFRIIFEFQIILLKLMHFFAVYIILNNILNVFSQNRVRELFKSLMLSMSKIITFAPLFNCANSVPIAYGHTKQIQK